MNFEEYDDLKNQRINIAVRLCHAWIAHHGHSARFEEFVGDAYEVTDEILKQGDPEFINRETKGQDWGKESNITSHKFKSYGDNII